MFDDGSGFFRRATAFVAMLKNNEYPNAGTLSSVTGKSCSTAKRDISRLQSDFHIPIAYDNSKKGFYLTDRNYQLPTEIPFGRDELAALLMARELVSSFGAEDIEKSLDALWSKFTASSSVVSRDLKNLHLYFSCDSTVVADIADHGVFEYLKFASTGAIVQITYHSPWKENEESAELIGRIEKLHIQDGTPYLLFHKDSGKELVLNASFIEDIKEFAETTNMQPIDPKYAKPDWLEGFGIFAGDKPQTLEIHIQAPGSRYYASQNWHESQKDEWHGDTLIRRLQGVISHEIVRRILSLGRMVIHVEPKELQEAVAREVRAMGQVFGG